MGQKVQMQKVASSTGAVAQTQPQQGQCVQVSQAMIGTQPTTQIISPIQVRVIREILESSLFFVDSYFVD